MTTTLKRCVPLWLIALLVVTNIACKDDAPTADERQHQISKIIESRYSSDPQLIGYSSKPPISYQGTTFYYALGTERTYRYDSQGRLVFDGQIDVDRPKDPYATEYNSYTYIGDRVIHYFSPVNGQDTLTLNSRGYAIPDFSLRGKTIYEYDKDNYLVRRLATYQSFTDLTSRVIVDGNIRKEVNENTSLISTIEQKYDLSRNALPNPQALFNGGKGSKNLLLGSVTQYKRPEPSNSYGSMDPYAVSASYTYEFDDLNRVSQQTIVATNTNTTAPIITVKRFTYIN